MFNISHNHIHTQQPPPKGKILGHGIPFLIGLIMSQFVFVEMEGTYPEDGVVLVEEEPGVADGVEVAYDVLVAGRGVAFYTHNGNLA
jgi:hypothetical protein